MRILFVTNLFPREARGGAERLVEALACASVHAGHEVHVLSTTSRRMSGVEISKRDGLTVHRYCPQLPYHLLEDAAQPLWKRVRWHVQDVLSARVSHDVRRAVENIDAHVIFSHNMRGMGLSLTRALRQEGAQWVHTLHDVQLLYPSGLHWMVPIHGVQRLWQSSMVMRPYQFAVRHLFGEPDVVIGPTAYIVDAHKAMGMFERSRAIVLENPLAHVPQGRRVQSHTPPRFLFVGQLESHKGADVLIEALNRLHAQVEVTIVGSGSRQDELMERAITLPDSVKVSFLGNVSHEEVLRMMIEHDVLVFPSLVAENCPGVLLEARSVGLPVIASDVGGVAEFVDVHALVPPGEPRALAQRMWQITERLAQTSPQPALTADAYVRRLLALVS
ncbi:hypothetical protein A3C17_04220 [Candidatus Uhrbacteria bacterium RIFCSPHIGHO2_02_FULL_53_13]|uniref:Glycosyltransferase subfamily 4-like N-terminal domain-containing protein n=1 Tax=Candidatus Uhrbacteria bacterium RIFCSPHIGHO2_02_FULL_53_13 TaxID=1802389 RepID=A0A1F7TWE9_9BACT|nr:MAG: hypothetical protein A3C17_04220 [Candidatus Uhrbacteria bacterium RIFCSPHIGHO2_02_FULL_53_13]